MKQLFKRGAAWLLSLALLASLFAGVPGTVLNHAHAAEEVTDASEATTNLLADYNASFEEYAIPNWTVDTGVNQSRDMAGDGNAWSLKISVQDAAATSDSIAVVPNCTYNASVEVLGAGKLTVIFYDADGAVLSDTDTAVSAATGEWETVTLSAVAPESAAAAAVKLSATTAEAVYFDDVSLVRGVALLNAGFEDWASDGSKPIHWVFSTTDGYALPEAEEVEGRGTVLTFNREDTKLNFYSEKFDIVGGAGYDVSIDVNTAVATTFYLYLQVWNAEGTQITSFGVPTAKTYESFSSNFTVDSWETITFSAVLPTTAAQARVLVYTANTTATGKMMFDNASVTYATELMDGSFENAPTYYGQANGHFHRHSKVGEYINTDSTYVLDGEQSFASDGSSYWFLSNAINVTPGETYSASISMISTADYLGGETVKKPQYYLYFYDASGTQLLVKSNTGIVLTEDWQTITLTGVAPEGAAYARTLLAPNTAVLYADCETFTQNTAVTEGNELANADFETVTVTSHSLVPNWVGSQYAGVAEEAMEIVYADAEHGNVAHISGSGAQVWLASKRLPAVPGEVYTASAKFAGTAGYVQLYLRFAATETTGASLSAAPTGGRIYGQTATFTDDSTGWVGISDFGTNIKDGEITLTAPEGANWVYVLLVAQPNKVDGAYADFDLYYDDVSLVKIADHTYTATVVEGSCTEDSYTRYDCICGDSYIDESTRVVADGHDYQGVVTNATCTTDGYTTFTCADCGDTYVGETVTASGHTPAEAVVENNVDPDCDTAGSYDSVVYCSVCGTELSRQNIAVDANGHTAGEAVVENNVDPDCTNAGSYDKVVYCTVCGEEISRQTVTVDATGHTYSSEQTKDPSCSAEGELTYTCSICGDTYTEPVDALDHTEAEAVIENKVESDCANAGSYDTVVYCSVCGEELSRVTTTVDALGHTEGEVVVENKVDADCENGGSYDNVIYCSVCGEEISRQTVTVDANGHTAGEAVVENNVDPGCGTTGSYDTVVYCTVCGEEISRQTVTVEATGLHTEAEAVKEVVVESDCVNYGYYNLVVYCSDCGTKLSSERFYEKALGHVGLPEVAENTINPTCTATGSYEAVTYCEICGVEVLRRLVEIPKLDHTYPETGTVTAPTCMKAGYTQYACVDCGYRYISDEVPATGHAWADDADTTCENGCGYIRTFHDGNLLNGYNPDFEEYGIADWDISDGVTQSRIADENLVTQSWCLRMAIQGATAVSNSLPVLPGWPYTLNVKVLGDGELSIVFYDEEGNMIDRIANAASTTEWATVEIADLIAPEKAHSAKIVLTATGEEPVYFDDAYMTSGEDVRLVSVPNGDFEDTETPGWFYESDYDNESGIVEMSDGNHAFYVTTNDLPFQFKSAPFSVRAGKAYMATIDAMIPQDGFLQVYVEYFNNDSQYLSRHRLASTYRATDVVTAEGEWVEIAVLMDCEIPAEATHARILVKTSFATTGTFYFDNARIFQTDSLYNPGFEGTVTSVGLPMGYTMSSENQDTTAEYVNTDLQYVYEGDKSLHLLNNCWIYSHYMNIHPGETYQSTFQIMTDVEWNSEVDTYVVNRIYFYDADFNPIMQNTENAEELAFITSCTARIEPTSEWTSFTATAVAPDNAVYARVMVTSQRGTSCYLDSGVFEKAADSNLIDHADFENVTVKNNSVISYWSGTQGLGQAESYMETVYVSGQDKVAHIHAYGDQVWIGSQRFPAIPGQKYTASAIFSGTAGYVNVYVRFAATATSGEGIKSTQESVGYAGTNTFTPESQGWVKVNDSNAKDILGNLYIQNGEITLTVPEGANYVYVLIVGVPESGEDGYGELDFYVDNVSLTKTAEHTYNPVVTDPTCTTAGYTTMVCACGDSYILEGSEVVALGHTDGEIVVENNVAPDCENTGSYDNVIYCTVCGAEVSRETVTVDALGHAYTSEITKQPTLNEEGIETFTCSNCGDTYTKPVAMLEGAVADVDGYKYATLAEALLNVLPGETVTLLQSCEITEDTVLKAGVTYYIPADLTLTVAEGATVTADAEATLNCAGTIIVAGTADISELKYGTTFGAMGGNLTIKSTGSVTMLKSWENVWTPVNDAQLGSMLLDCEAGAYVEIGAQQWQLNEAWEHLNHVHTSEQTKDPTCTAEGELTYTCPVCGDTYTEPVDALGHTEAEAVVENKVEADCTNAGSYDTVVYCSVCGEELSRETTTVDALGHTEAEAVVENNVAPDCTNAGSYDTVVYCSVCGEELSRVTTIVDALGHTEVIDEAKAPTCTATGLTEGKHCSVCGEILIAQAEVTATGHAYTSEQTKDPTCTAEGELTYTCGNCGDTYTEPVDALGHTEAEAVVENKVEADCTNAGSYDTVVYCSVCGEELSRVTTTVDALGHTEVIDEAKAPTCTATGLTEGKHCSVCGEILIAQAEVTATGHAYTSEQTKDPTCTAEGELTYTCGNCGDTYTEPVDALGHTHDEQTDCTVAVNCSVCDTEIYAAKAHTYDDDQDATCNACDYERVILGSNLKPYTHLGLSFPDYIGIQFMMLNSDIEMYDNVYLKVVQTTPDGDVETIINGILYNSKATLFDYPVMSWSMTENVRMTICGEKDGVLYEGETFNTSVMELGMSKIATYLESGDMVRVQAMVDMLNYGAAVQTVYDYNAASLPNVNLGEYAQYGTTDIPEVGTVNTISGDGTVKIYRSNVSMQAKVELQIMVKTADLEGMTVKATLDGTEMATSTAEYGAYTVVRVGIGAAQLRDFFTIAVYDADGNAASQVYNVSVEAYVAEKIDGANRDALIALMRFGDSVSKLV